MKRHASREKFYRAALELCAEKGYYQMRMDEVVRRAQSSKGALYHHFESKQDLFLEACEHGILRVQERLANALSSGTSAPDLLRNAFAVLAETARDRAFVRSLVEFYVVGMHEPAVRASFRRFYEETLAFGRAVIEMGIDRGDFHKVDADLVSRALFMGGDGAIILHLALGEDERASDVLFAYLEVVMRGLSASASAPTAACA